MQDSEDDRIETLETASASSRSGGGDKSPKKTLPPLQKWKNKKNKIGGSPSPPLSAAAFESKTGRIDEIVEMFEIKSGRTVKTKSRSSVLTTKSSESDENAIAGTTKGTAMTKAIGKKQRKSITVSETTESVFSLKSDGKSYREKLRERFQTIKEKTEKSLTKARTKTRRGDIELYRNVLGKENQLIETELDAYEKRRTVNQAEAYNFFCGDNGVDGDSGVSPVRPDSNESPVKYRVPDLLDLAETEQETFVWFICGAGDELVPEERLKEDAQPRYLAEEGYYVGGKPEVSGARLRLLERRLYGVGDKKWFDCEGELNILPDPRSSKCHREDLTATTTKDASLETVFVPGALQEKHARLESVSVQGSKMLRIQLSTVTFDHHPLFGAEHVAERQLIHLYGQYETRTLRNQTQNKLKQRLEALRNAKKNLQQNRAKSNGEEDEDDDDVEEDDRLRTYSEQIVKLRAEYWTAARKDRDTLKAIIRTWRLLKKVRAEQGYSATSAKLKIVKEEVTDADEDAAKRRRDFDCAVREIVGEMTEEHARRMDEYRDGVRVWKQEKKAGGAGSDVTKPKKPADVDVDKVKDSVSATFRECFRSPGEPVLRFELIRDADAVTTAIEDERETNRRACVSATKVYFKVFCNDLLVCKSKPVQLNDRFEANVRDSFCLYVTDFPDYVLVELHETSPSIGKRKLGTFRLKVLNVEEGFDEEGCKETAFVSDTSPVVRGDKHFGVGSGIAYAQVFERYGPELQPPETEKRILYTSAKLAYKLTSNVAEKDKLTTEAGLIDAKRLEKWVETNKPDPQDPKNDVIYEYIRNAKSDADDNVHNYFRLNPQLEALQFCQREALDNNVRFKFLQLRNRNEPEFVGMKIANRHQEIPLNLLSQYEKRVARERNLSETLGQDTVAHNHDSVEGKRLYGRRFLRQCQRRIYKQCKVSENTLGYDDVICEDVVPALSTVGLNFLDWILPARLLNMAAQMSPPFPSPALEPSPTATKSAATEAPPPGTKPVTKLYVKIFGATNVPVKRDTTKTLTSSRTWSHNSPALTATTSADAGASRCFVEVTFQNVTVKTRSLPGPAPNWNEELCVPLDLEPAAFNGLHSFCDSLKVNLFDENVTDLLEDQRLRQQSVHQHLGRNWLGSVLVPFSAFCCNRIEGDFRLASPATLLGYQRDFYEQQTPSSSSVATQKNAKDVHVRCHVWLQPKVPQLTYDLEELESKELPHVKQHIVQWTEYVAVNYPHRKFSPLVIDIDGKTGCATRYLTATSSALETPQLDGLPLTAEQCARYVSLIPFTVHHNFYKNIWLTGDQLLNLGIGSVADHCVLLMAYLQNLHVRCWLLLGYGVPQGSTAYVLTLESEADVQGSSLHVYDVTTGRKFKLHDKLCPLQKIYCIISSENVWANVQWEDTLDLMRFDFARSSDWLPMYTRRVSAPKTVATQLQQQGLAALVAPPNYPDLQPLEQHLEKKLRKKIMKWRRHETTVWNHYCCSVLKRAAKSMEMAAMFGNMLTCEPPPAELQALTASHKIFGFALNLPFTSTAELVEFVRTTSFHQSSSPNAEFAIGLALNPYPNSVIAVWIYLVTMEVRI